MNFSFLDYICLKKWSKVRDMRSAGSKHIVERGFRNFILDFERIPEIIKELTETQIAGVEKLIEKN